MAKKFVPVMPLCVGGFDPDEHSDRFGTRCEDVSLARQSEREDADINTIIRRFGLTGQMPKDQRPLMYGDFTGITDFESALAAVVDAQELFMTMPAEVRSRFRNDPQEFLLFCSDEKNRDEMKKLGLLVPEPVVQGPVKVEITNAVVEPAKPASVVLPSK